jgi:hypothetical protein
MIGFDLLKTNAYKRRRKENDMKSILACCVVVTFLMTAKMSAGQIFIDTQGPQVTDVTLDDGVTPVFDPSGIKGCVRSIIIHFQDSPNRVVGFLYEAFPPSASQRGPVYNRHNYELVRRGTYYDLGAVREVRIDQVVVTLHPPVGDSPATAQVELIFEVPLRSGFYTLKVLDNMFDPAGNRLDGDTWGPYTQPDFTDPVFSTGDGTPGGDFICRFRIRKWCHYHR